MTASSPDGRGTRPLSRRSSKILVITLGLLAFALALASSLYLIHTARESRLETVPAQEETMPADSSATRSP